MRSIDYRAIVIFWIIFNDLKNRKGYRFAEFQNTGQSFQKFQMYTRATSAEATLDTSSGMRGRGGHPDHVAGSVFNHDIGSVRRPNDLYFHVSSCFRVRYSLPKRR